MSQIIFSIFFIRLNMNDSDFWSESNVLGGTKFGLYSQINCNLKLVYLVSIFNVEIIRVIIIV